MTDEDEIESGKGKKKKQTPPDPFKIYGEGWDGKWQKIGDLANLIPPFKDFYFEKKREDLDASAMRILRDFNATIKPEKFFPYPAQYRSWRRKWDTLILAEIGYKNAMIEERKRIDQVVRVRDEERGFTLIPGDDELERATNTLGGMLANDAVEMLQNDKELEDIYTSDELIKRKTYALNVFSHITRKVQGKEALKIKRAGEAREQAGFLMNLLNRAVAGKVSEDDFTTLRSAAVVVDAKPIHTEPQTT